MRILSKSKKISKRLLSNDYLKLLSKDLLAQYQKEEQQENPYLELLNDYQQNKPIDQSNIKKILQKKIIMPSEETYSKQIQEYQPPRTNDGNIQKDYNPILNNHKYPLNSWGAYLPEDFDEAMRVMREDQIEKAKKTNTTVTVSGIATILANTVYESVTNLPRAGYAALYEESPLLAESVMVVEEGVEIGAVRGAQAAGGTMALALAGGTVAVGTALDLANVKNPIPSVQSIGHLATGQK